jgi:hypothetical protein
MTLSEIIAPGKMVLRVGFGQVITEQATIKVLVGKKYSIKKNTKDRND